MPIHKRPAASARFQNAGTQMTAPTVNAVSGRNQAIAAITAASGSDHWVGYTGNAVSTYRVVAAARP